MTPEQADIIKSSWQTMVSKNGSFNAMLFYNNLFDAEPQIRDLFPPVVESLSKKFKYTMKELVENCDRLGEEKTQEMLIDLGSIHKKLRVENAHYDLITKTIIRTVEQSLGEKFTDEIGYAWYQLLSEVSSYMKSAPERKLNKFQELLHRLFGRDQY